MLVSIHPNTDLRGYGTTALFALFLFAGSALAADWPHFRGTNRDAVIRDTKIKTTWDKPIPMLWDREIGSAFSSFALADGKLYTCGMNGGQQTLVCLNPADGVVIFEKPIESEFKNEHGDGTRATPSVSDGRVYILGAHGRLLCADAKTGDTVWEKTFQNKPTWAYSGSVLIDGDMAVVSAGKEDGSLIAYNKVDGKEIWKTGNDLVGYATPYPFTFEGKRYIVGFMGTAAVIVDAATGREVWRQEWKTDWDVNAATPIFHDGHLLLSSGYRTGAGLFKLRPEGDKLASDTVWQSKVLLNKFQTPVLYEGKLYTSDQRALKCVDFLTGKEHWQINRIAHGTVLIADGNIVLLTEGGELQIGKASPEKFEPTTKAEILSGRCWTLPILVDGKLYARNLERVACFDLRG